MGGGDSKNENGLSNIARRRHVATYPMSSCCTAIFREQESLIFRAPFTRDQRPRRTARKSLPSDGEANSVRQIIIAISRSKNRDLGRIRASRVLWWPLTWENAIWVARLLFWQILLLLLITLRVELYWDSYCHFSSPFSGWGIKVKMLLISDG